MLSQKHEDQSTGGGDGSGGRSTSSLRPPAEQTLKCPRCDSPNTKFCYYNNYNLAQPRHFCKACRRYWTKGGALRNVPIGGNCRKNKKTKSYSKYSSSNIENNMKMFGLSTLDFQLGSGLNFPPRVTTANQLCSSYGDHTSSNHSLVNLDPLGYNLPFSSNNNIVMGTNNNIASSIESLSSINQDLHWKLQQQRLAMLFGGGGPHNQKVQPILFQNLETSKPAQSSINGDSGKESIIGGSSGLATEWFFDSSYAPGNMNDQGNASNGNGAGNDENGSMDNWNGIQSWNDHLNQYSDGVSYEG